MGLRDARPPRAEDRAPVSRERTLVLEEDRALFDTVAPEHAQRARGASLAAVLRRRTGSWDAARDAGVARGGFGLLVLDGVLIRRVGVDGRFGAELLAAGDLLRPWQHDGEAGVLPFQMAWRIVSPIRLAALDRGWATRMASDSTVASAWGLRRGSAPTPASTHSGRSVASSR